MSAFHPFLPLDGRRNSERDCRRTNGSGRGPEPFVGDQVVSSMAFESRGSLTTKRTLLVSVNVRNPPIRGIRSDRSRPRVDRELTGLASKPCPMLAGEWLRLEQRCERNVRCLLGEQRRSDFCLLDGHKHCDLRLFGRGALGNFRFLGFASAATATLSRSFGSLTLASTRSC